MPVLEEIPESPTANRLQHSDAPSTMTILEGSSNFTIAGSHINNVVGPQHNNIYNGPVTIQQVMRGPEERQLTIWDEFERVPTGKVYITKTWCTTNVEWDPDYNQWKNRKRRGIDAQRTINTARIGSSEYLYIGYSGVNASEVGQLFSST
ncbi:hypothetical protein VNI00_009103 [Paramarasmius palmivorus]|uniref:Uncharacterized protein n=1 Tax=Paramarasmius palmivorus TaxID=297713 RepID=A0AAW0CSY0_9AGAR